MRGRSLQVQCKHGEMITLPIKFLKKFEYFDVLLSNRWKIGIISVPEVQKSTLLQLFENKLQFSLDLIETVDFLGNKSLLKTIDENLVYDIINSDEANQSELRNDDMHSIVKMENI